MVEWPTFARNECLRSNEEMVKKSFFETPSFGDHCEFIWCFGVARCLLRAWESGLLKVWSHGAHLMTLLAGDENAASTCFGNYEARGESTQLETSLQYLSW